GADVLSVAAEGGVTTRDVDRAGPLDLSRHHPHRAAGTARFAVVVPPLLPQRPDLAVEHQGADFQIDHTASGAAPPAGDVGVERAAAAAQARAIDAVVHLPRRARTVVAQASRPAM